MQHRILVIDDDELIVESIAELLEFEGFDVMVAVDADEGIELAHTQQPDLILCDIHMPVTNGFDVLNALHALRQARHIPFVLMSGTGIENKAFQSNISAFVVKPFLASTLLDTIHQLLK